MDDYVHITSFSHFPFYSEGVLEVPDNWEMSRFYNVPLDELIQIMDNALNAGYTVNWDGDVSERGFSHANGVAINPDMTKIDVSSMTDRARFENMSSDRSAGLSFDKPYPEIDVTQEVRQDQNGTKYYITKNSWGTDRNPQGGYLNMSESFVRAKTIYIMVHRDAIPGEIKTKLGI